MSHCVPLDAPGVLSQCWKCLQDLLNSPASCPCMSLLLASPRPGCHRPVPGPLQSLNSEKKSPGTASSTFHFFFGQPRKWRLTLLVSPQLQEVTGEQKGKRLGVGGAFPSGTKDVSAKTAASLLPQVFSQLVAHRVPSAGTWLISPLSVLLSVLFLFVNLFPALFPP